MNDFLALGAATGLPWESKPFFTAAASSCCCVIGVPELGMNDDGVTGAAATGGWVAGPGGISRSPLRPQAASESAATTAAASATPTLRRSRAKGLSPTHALTQHSKPDRGGDIVSATSCQSLYQAVYGRFFNSLSQRLACARTFCGAVPP